jgi:multidrug efflux pump subunit AcrA (membrane-fusion protein)
MKRTITILLLLLLAAAGWWGYQQYQAQQAATVAAEEAKALADASVIEEMIFASGKLEPVLWANLGPQAGGRVTKIYSEEGQWVTAGTLLLEVDNGMLASQVTIAEAAVAEAEAALAQVQAAASPADLAAGEAQVAGALAQVELASTQMTDVGSAVAEAEAALALSRAAYAELASHPTAAETVAGRAAVAQAEAAVRTAAAAYNRVKDEADVGARPESLAMMQATAGLEAANAQFAVTATGPTAQQLGVAAQEVAMAQVRVDSAGKKMAAAEAAVRAALAAYAGAVAALDKQQEPPGAEEVALAEAHVGAAQAGLAAAEAALAQTQVVAPFDGLVSTVAVRLGEQVTPGATVVTLGDTAAMEVRTTDLRETDVLRLSEGMTVEVSFDALPEQVFTGAVRRIAPMSTADKGSTNYTLAIDLVDAPASLRWGMTAFVNIRPVQ